jgi:putative ABC transport system substrate-binding protein
VRSTITKLTVIVAVLLLAMPLSAVAQQSGKLYRIGMLETVAASSNTENLQAFREKLNVLGYAEGQNLTIEYRSADGSAERFPGLAAELVRLPVDLIVTRGTPAALAAKKATSTIPIVMAASGDPVRTGLVQGLARPGGNLTGLTSLTPEMAGKRLQLLRAAFPTSLHVAVLWNPSNPAATNAWREAETAARVLGVVQSSLEIRKTSDIAPAFDAGRKYGANVVVVVQDALTQNHHREIVDLAKRHRLLDVYASREFVEAGGLMSYGPSYPDLYRRAAMYVDRILKGAKRADLPIEQPTKFELVVNRRTARALSLTIPPSLLVQADHVIE